MCDQSEGFLRQEPDVALMPFSILILAGFLRLVPPRFVLTIANHGLLGLDFPHRFYLV